MSATWEEERDEKALDGGRGRGGALLGVSAAQAKGPGGNSANAKLCQKGSETLYAAGSTTPFASETECVSYGAQGGTIVAKSAARLKCEELGGEFRPDLAGETVVWVCRFVGTEILGNPPNYAGDGSLAVSQAFSNLCSGGLRLWIIQFDDSNYTHLVCERSA